MLPWQGTFMTPRPVILDCDTGTDDAIAIMLAGLHPDLDLLGVTTVFGNLPVTNTTDNTLRVLEHIGRGDVSVYAGAAGPIGPRPALPDLRVLPSALPLPRPTGSSRWQPAAEWLVEILRQAADPVTLVSTGPFSNLAAALALDPAIVGKLETVVLMGGSDRVPSVTPLAERNVWNDPVAADRVLAAGLDVVLVTLDATTSSPLSEADAHELEALDTPAGSATAALVRERIDLYAGASAPGTAPVHDAFTVAWLLDPAVVDLQPMQVRIELAEGSAYARTHIDDGEPNARVALTADGDRFRRLLLETFAG